MGNRQRAWLWRNEELKSKWKHLSSKDNLENILMILHCPSFPFDALHSDLMNYQPYYQATEMLMNNDGLSMHVYEAIKSIYIDH